MVSSANRTRANLTPLSPYRPPHGRHLHIEDYRFGRWLTLTRAAEVRRQRTYFPRGSAPFGHYTSRLRHEQRGMLKLRALCRSVREEAERVQALWKEDRQT